MYCIYSSIISKCQEDTSISIGSMNVSLKSTLLFLFHHYQTNKYKVSIEGKRYKIVCFIGVGITCTFLLHFTLLRSKKEVSFLHDIINFHFFCASFMIKLLYLDFLFDKGLLQNAITFLTSCGQYGIKWMIWRPFQE